MYRLVLVLLIATSASLSGATECPEPYFPSYDELKSALPEVQAVLSGFLVPGIEQMMAQHGMASVHATVIYNDQVWLQRGFGRRDPTNATAGPLQADDVVPVGSITKSFTSLMLMLLRDRGLLHVDDPVADQLPELRPPYAPAAAAHPAQLQELAMHESGLWRQLDCPTCYTDAAVLAADAHPPLWIPSTQGWYSNAATGLLGSALGRIAQRALSLDYYQFQRRHIALPLGLLDTAFSAAEVRGRLATGYFLLENGTYLPTAWNDSRSYLDPSGSLLSSPRDMARYMQFLVESPALPDLLSASTRREWLRVRSWRAYDGSGYSYGLETHLCNHTRRYMVGKDGAGDGFVSQFMTIPALRVGVFLTSNTAVAGFALNSLVEETVDRLGAAVESLLVERYPLSPVRHPQLYTGRYEQTFAPGMTTMKADVSVGANGSLLVQFSDFLLMPAPFHATLFVDPAVNAFRGVLTGPAPLCDFTGARDYMFFDEPSPGSLNDTHASTLSVPGQMWVFQYSGAVP